MMITMTKKNGSKKKLPLSRRKEIILEIIFFAVIIALTFSFMPIMKASLKTDYPLVVVTSGSMEPLISEGDLLIIEGKAPDDIEVGDHTTLGGDIILYDAEGLGWESRSSNEPIVHRCVEKIYNETEGLYYFKAFGDANSIIDPVSISEDYILGVVRHIIPAIGWPKLWMARNNLFSTVLIIGLAVLLVISIVNDYMHPEDENDKNEESNYGELSTDSDRSLATEGVGSEKEKNPPKSEIDLGI